MSDEKLEVVPADLTPAEKEALAKRTNAQLDLSKVCAQFAAHFQLPVNDAGLLANLFALQATFDSLVDLLMDKPLLCAYPPLEGEPDGAAPHVGPSVLTRVSYFEVAALKMEQSASKLRRQMLATNPSQMAAAAQRKQ